VDECKPLPHGRVAEVERSALADGEADSGEVRQAGCEPADARVGHYAGAYTRSLQS